MRLAGDVTSRRGWSYDTLGDKEVNCREGSDQTSLLSFLSQVERLPHDSCQPDFSTHSVGWRGAEQGKDKEFEKQSQLWTCLLPPGVSSAGNLPPRQLRVYHRGTPW